uniref:Uncharacterized protein n=1 Tax=Chromera velia CCMP2878 TaxID=1169474 RepID=A0A0G4HW62_9ALVE|eukprot:Cvel_32535.t1-p1 / transcript=Cvel_32535.t1 / gene=Cvel_32535 / organism=Chromera_velia_CCMP2878 / gene_product=hypothetical protein / transcript_product=hypothetical protein / location=Cvel_scaffold5083:5275-6552(-) / protein_length=254 / sequence_SO=supercontig / SO=protein_coding / is_pseudo=false
MGPLAEEVTPPSAPFGSQLAMRPFYYDFLPSVKWRQPANRFVPVSLEPPTNHGGAPPPPPKPSQPSVVMGMPPNGGAPTVGMSAQMPFTRVPGAGLHGSAGPSRRQPAWGPMDYSEEPLGGGGESPLRTAMRESQGRVEAALEGDGDIEGGPLGGIRGKRLEGEGGRGGGSNSWQQQQAEGGEGGARLMGPGASLAGGGGSRGRLMTPPQPAGFGLDGDAEMEAVRAAYEENLRRFRDLKAQTTSHREPFRGRS